MSLQKYVKVFFIFFFSTQACHPQTTIPNFLGDLEAFLIEKGEKYTAKRIKKVHKRFDKFYARYAEEDPALWNFDFKTNPFENKKEFEEFKWDEETFNYVKHLRRTRDKYIKDFHYWVIEEADLKKQEIIDEMRRRIEKIGKIVRIISKLIKLISTYPDYIYLFEKAPIVVAFVTRPLAIVLEKTHEIIIKTSIESRKMIQKVIQR